MSNLFKKAAIFSDPHLGLKQNSLTHLEDCKKFTEWFISESQKENCDVCMMLGDFFNNRNNVNLVSLNYGLQILRLLSDAFDRVIVLTGNHDCYFKNNRSIHSVSWAEHIPNVEIINDIYTENDVTFLPWLNDSDFVNIPKINSKYVFGHLELPNFLMNSRVPMPIVSELNSEVFKNFGEVYSGHFHMRQKQNNITYIGNAFPHNFGDANDDNRGMMILPYGEEPKFIAWPNAPKYRIVKISELVVDPSLYLPINGYIKLMLDSDVSYEEAAYLKETLVEEYELREMTLVQMKKQSFSEDLSGLAATFQSVDSIVQSQISEIKSDFFDNNLLLEIYRSL
jgi:DNA repair exonuclease SbcCD nuclease subunit